MKKNFKKIFSTIVTVLLLISVCSSTCAYAQNSQDALDLNSITFSSDIHDKIYLSPKNPNKNPLKVNACQNQLPNIIQVSCKIVNDTIKVNVANFALDSLDNVTVTIRAYNCGILKLQNTSTQNGLAPFKSANFKLYCKDVTEGVVVVTTTDGGDSYRKVYYVK